MIGNLQLPVSSHWRLAGGHIQLIALPIITIRRSASFGLSSMCDACREFMA